MPKSLAIRVALLALTTSLSSAPVAAQEDGSTAPPGWERFVAPVLEEAEEVGVTCFPAVFSGGQVVEILDPKGYEVHMTPADDPGEETVYPAGEPFIPAAGRWRVWLQGEWSMTPYSVVQATPPRGRWTRLIPHTYPVAPAGRVDVAAGALTELGVESEPDLWLLSAASDRLGGQSELSRRRPVGDLGEGVLMPAETTLAGLRDRRLERWLAFSRPFDVEARTTTPTPLARPKPGEAWLKAYVQIPGSPESDRLAGMELTVEGHGESFRPDVTVRTMWGMHAVWYGLQPGPAVLSGGDDELYLEPRDLELADAEIGDFTGDLVERPSLEVTLLLPALLREKPFSLEVREVPDGDTLAEVELSRDAGRHRFDRLVRGVLEVVLETHVGPHRRQVDLTSEQEGFLLLDPEVIEVFGTVRHGGEPHPARLEFQTVTGDTAEAAAGEDGEYRAFALHPLLWLTVELADEELGEEERRREPWVDTFMPPIRHSRELNVEIPDVETIVRVVDAITREGVPGAQVSVRNEYLLPVEPGAEEDGDAEEPRGRERKIGRSHEADDGGVVHLPPPRPGRVEIQVFADGYRPMEKPLELEVADPPRDLELEIPLQPFGELVELHLTLPDGSPAARAEVMRVSAISSRDVLFSGRADDAGVVDVPVEPAGGLLLLSHAAAASAVIDWPQAKDRERLEWSFPPAAGRPLTLRAVDPAGTGPAPGAQVAVWLGDRRVSGPFLHWLLEARPRTDRNGFWTARHLPAAPVRALAWSRDVSDQAALGALDTLAVTVPFPWPDTVDVEAIR